MHDGRGRGTSERGSGRAATASAHQEQGPVNVPSAGWRRLSFRRSWAWLELPVVVVILASTAILLAILLTDDAYEILRKLFAKVSPGEEANVGTWVNAGLWLVAGLLAGYIALHVREHRKSWAAVSALSVYFSLDETMMLHERLDRVFADLGQLLPVATFVWVIPGTIFALVAAGLLLRMVLSLPQISRNGLLVGGAVFVLGSIIMEGIGGFLYFEQGEESLPYITLTIFEEACEMTGVALAIASMLHLIEWRRTDGAMSYRISARREAGTRVRA